MPPETQRPRIFICGGKTPPLHGHIFTYVMNIFTIIGAGTFVWGSWCFFGDKASLARGDILYVVGSVIYLFQSLYLILEVCHSRRALNTGQHLEILENLSYVIACIIFTAGTVLFWPGLFEDETQEKLMESYGAALFIAGSFLFVAAAAFNSLTIQQDNFVKTLTKGSEDEDLVQAAILSFRLSAIALFACLFGGVLFVCGSYLFRPEYSKKSCEDLAQETVQNVAEGNSSQFEKHDQICASVVVDGTWLFLWGSCLYTVQAITVLCNTILKAKVFDKLKERGFKMDDSRSGSGSDEESS